jgi:glycosyltransferase involved in cell wall biosynthesis
MNKIAIIADQMTAFGGADRQMISMLKILPQADIYTVLFDRKKYRDITNKVYSSFLQKFPFKYKLSKHLKIFNPIAYESFDLREYDTIISISAGPAKGIIPDIYQTHIAMVMTPPRSLWDHELNVRATRLKRLYRFASSILNNYLRIWDITISKRVDYWVANSNFIATKVKKRYGVNCDVIYPGIQKDCFKKYPKKDIEEIVSRFNLQDEFALVVSRLYDYKKVDWAIEACKESGTNLVIVGSGPDEKFLKQKAKGCKNIYFIGFLKSDDDVRKLYKKASVLLFCGIEDFGLVPVEAMAQGTPIFAYNYGGVKETVLENVCGKFFNSKEELSLLLKNFDKTGYNSQEIENRAREFSEEIFLQKLEKYINEKTSKTNI